MGSYTEPTEATLKALQCSFYTVIDHSFNDENDRYIPKPEKF